MLSTHNYPVYPHCAAVTEQRIYWLSPDDLFYIKDLVPTWLNTQIHSVVQTILTTFTYDVDFFICSCFATYADIQCSKNTTMCN